VYNIKLWQQLINAMIDIGTPLKKIPKCPTCTYRPAIDLTNR